MEKEQINFYSIIKRKIGKGKKVECSVFQNQNMEYKNTMGYCSYYKNKVTLNLQLTKKSSDYIKQFVLYEVIYFIYLNDSKEFYEFLTLLMLDCRKQKGKLENTCFNEI